MNYPIKVRKAFTRVRYQVNDAWQNLRNLKRNISCLVRSIDDVGNGVNRSRRLLQQIQLPRPAATDDGVAVAQQATESYSAGALR